MILETERLLLRGIDLNDANDIFEYSTEKNVGPNAGWKPHENLEETAEIIKTIFLNQENVFGIIYKENQKMIGSIGLIPDPKRDYDKTLMLGYALSEKYWGKGIMTEATNKILYYGFKHLQIDLISAYIYPHNERSKRVIEKCGFSYEGTLKLSEKLYNGKVYDNVCYALLK